MPRSKSGNGEDRAKTLADAAYIAKAAKAMRWVVRLAMVATLVVLYFMLEPVVRGLWTGDLQEGMKASAEARMKAIQAGDDPGPMIQSEWMQWAATVGGGLVMMLLLAGLNGALKRMERSSQQTLKG